MAQMELTRKRAGAGNRVAAAWRRHLVQARVGGFSCSPEGTAASRKTTTGHFPLEMEVDTHMT